MGLKVAFLTVYANLHLKIIDFRGEKIKNDDMADYRHVGMFTRMERRRKIDSPHIKVTKKVIYLVQTLIHRAILRYTLNFPILCMCASYFIGFMSKSTLFFFKATDLDCVYNVSQCIVSTTRLKEL